MSRYLFYLLVFIVFASCSKIRPIKTGQEAYSKEQFDLAIQLYEKELRKTDDGQERVQVFLDMATSAIRLNRIEDAKMYAQNALNISSDGKAEVLLAEIAFREKNYPEAERLYRDAGISLGDPFRFRREISDARVLKTWSKLHPKKIAESWNYNSAFNDYSIKRRNQDVLVFTSDRPYHAEAKKYTQTGNYFHRLYSMKEGNIKLFDAPFNQLNNIGTASFSNDGNYVIFSQCNVNPRIPDPYCKLYESYFKNGKWSPAKQLEICAEDANYVHPELSNDGTELYFACDAENGWGGYDIYYAEISKEGRWLKSKLMNRAINTPGNEKFPSLDMDTLYFSSDYHTGFGGLDIFKTYPINASRWSQALNLKLPYNSGGDDFGYFKDQEAEYITSNRSGADHIYILKDNPEPPKDDEVELPFPNIYLEVSAVHIEENSDRTIPAYDAKIKLLFQGNVVKPINGTNSRLTFPLDSDQEYLLEVSEDAYFTKRTVVSTEDIQLMRGASDLYLEREIVLDPIQLDKEITLEDIYYDFDKWDIREDAKPSLLQLKKIMLDNPMINIQLSSHTDCRGNEIYNQELSQKRAQSARDFLIAEGIEGNRITAVGYGENRLLIDCKCERCTEEEHQLNRRTTFKVVSDNP